jgi:hypothetical protein
MFTKLHFVDILFFIAVMTFQNTPLLVYHIEDSLHWLIVGDALGIVALHNATQLVGCLNGFLLHHLVVADDIEHDFWSYDAKAGDFLLAEELVGNLDDSLASNLL